MRIGVMMGGISSERDISLQSGKNIINNLDKSQYTIVPIEINEKKDVIEKVKDIDFVFLALHGQFGEDGSVQAILDSLGVPYSGCGFLSSCICMDKDITKKILAAEKINTAKWTVVKNINDINYETIKNIGYPVFVKPNSGGSSVATVFVEKEQDLKKAIELALNYDKEVLVEEYIEGEEITCPVFNNKTFPILTIKPTGKFFDKESKYKKGGAAEELANYDKETTRKIEETALKTYKALKCSVYARVDIILKDGIPYVLEVNTLPGMTKNSLVPKSAAAMNLNYSKLLDFIIELSLKK
ncbi:D-alanine--D-alanine ligase [Clostridium sp.]|uniref:D-alanine--D-alanine ligase n=1 Tax=Clostridium sp. TaxID=1506 RepID=UPI0039957F49